VLAWPLKWRSSCVRGVLSAPERARAWRDRDSSENTEKFKELIWEKVRLIIQMPLEKQANGKTDAASIDAQARQRMERLKQVVPFYSIEAWLFQNIREAIRLCETHHSGRDVMKFRAWEQERSALDEVMKPKEAVCQGAKHNLTLASQGFPAREARGAGKSFASVVQMLSQDAELREALRRTYSSE
jgi:hypothetical protein